MGTCDRVSVAESQASPHDRSFLAGARVNVGDASSVHKPRGCFFKPPDSEH
jgi:hypothetical protein